MSEPENILREKLSIAWRFFYGRGFVDGFGHISARTEDPNVVLMTPHDLGKLSHPEDFLLCDLDGNLIGKEGKLPGELRSIWRCSKHARMSIRWRIFTPTTPPVFRCLSTT